MKQHGTYSALVAYPAVLVIGGAIWLYVSPRRTIAAVTCFASAALLVSSIYAWHDYSAAVDASRNTILFGDVHLGVGIWVILLGGGLASVGSIYASLTQAAHVRGHVRTEPDRPNASTRPRERQWTQLLGISLLALGFAVPVIAFFTLDDPGDRYRGGDTQALDWSGYAGWYLNAGRSAAAFSLVCFTVAAILQLRAPIRSWGLAGWSLLAGVTIDLICLLPTRRYDRRHVLPIIGRPFEEVQGWIGGGVIIAGLPLLAVAAALTLASIVALTTTGLGIGSPRSEKARTFVTWAAILCLVFIPFVVGAFEIRADYDPS